MADLYKDLYVKHPLRCKNGKFRILTFSDTHGVVDFDRRLVRDLDAMLEVSQPDLVLFLGDQVWRDAAENEENLRGFLAEYVAPIEKRQIPWAQVFGNHDAERGFAVKDQQNVYQSFAYNVSKRGPEDIHGTSNYVLPILNTEGDAIIYNVWCLDTNRDMHEYLTDNGFEDDYKQVMMPDPLYVTQGYDSVRFDQMLWYWNTSAALETYNGTEIPALMVMHMPIPEYVVPYKNVAQCRYKGYRREQVGTTPLNPGLFSCLIQRGDVRTVISGHDHINDCEGVYLGVKLAYDAGVSYDCYCDEDMRGGRIVDIDENDAWHIDTYMLRAKDCVEKLGMAYPGEAQRQ